MLCLSGFELYSRWVPLLTCNPGPQQDGIQSPLPYHQLPIVINLLNH